MAPRRPSRSPPRRSPPRRTSRRRCAAREYPLDCADVACPGKRAPGSEKRCASRAAARDGVLASACCDAREAVRLREAAASMADPSARPYLEARDERERRRRVGGHFAADYKRLLMADKALPKPSDPLWADAPRATAVLQETLARLFALPAAYRGRPAAPPCGVAPPPLDAWQLAAAVPCLRRRELLVVADTGTGKSFAWATVARAMHEKGLRVVVLVKDQAAAHNQFDEMLKSPAWHDLACTGALHAMASVGERRRPPRPVSFLTYVQAGNDAREGAEALDGAAVLMDEVHELATPEAAGAWAPSVRELAAHLARRRYGFLLGLTATPLVDFESFVALLAQFAPRGMDPPTLADLGLEDVPVAAEGAACGVRARRVAPAAALAARLRGLAVVYYSADRDAVDFPVLRPPRVVEVELAAADKDLLSVARKDWNKPPRVEPGVDPKLDSAARLGKIVDAAAPAVFAQLDPRRKAAVFATTRGMAANLHAQLRARDAGRAYEFVLLTDDLPQREVAARKAAFGRAGGNAVLVSHLAFATGHTFDDPRDPQGRGIRLLVSVQLRTLKGAIQLAGRARRRRSHAGYPADERDVEQVVVIPRVRFAPGAPKRRSPGCASRKRADCAAPCAWRPGKGCAAADEVAPAAAPPAEVRRTCEHVFHDHVARERANYEAVLGALFRVSYGRDAFWARRPAFVEEDAPTPAAPPSLARRVADAVRAVAAMDVDALADAFGALKL